MKQTSLLLLAAIAFLTSCSPRLSTFTRNLYEDQGWNDAQLKKIQFYLSDDLTLRRNVDEDNDTKIEDGRIKVVDGRKVEEIFFRRGTPGIFISRPKDNHFAISFENKDDSWYLTFGPNPKRDGEYMLLASEWNRRSGVVTYGGKKYTTYSDDIPRLLVDLKRQGYYKKEDRTVKGRTVKN